MTDPNSVNTVMTVLILLVLGFGRGCREPENGRASFDTKPIGLGSMVHAE